MDVDTVDVWTLVHHLYGVYFHAVLRVGFGPTVWAAVAWEIAENSRWGARGWGLVGVHGYTGDTLRNSVMDVVATAAGWWLAHMRRRH